MSALCLDVTELLDPAFARMVPLLVDRLEASRGEKVVRLYVGSSMCERYFCAFGGWREVVGFARERGLPLTLVVPSPGQSGLDPVKRRVSFLVEDGGGLVDELTVNDLGMLRHVARRYRLPVNLGRLLCRESRDPRMPSTGVSPRRLAWGPLLGSVRTLVPEAQVRGAEMDAVNGCLDISHAGVPVALREPFCYLTTGRICKLASIHLPPEGKFRPAGPCRLECQQVCEVTTGRADAVGHTVALVRFGCSVFYRAPMPELRGGVLGRIVHVPLAERLRFMDGGCCHA